MKVRIEIDTRTFVRFWLVVIGFALAILMIYTAREALMVLGVAAFLALALSYPVSRLAKLFPGKSRLGGTALAFVSLIVALGAVIWFVVPPLIEQTAKFAQTIPDIVSNINNEWHGVREFIDKNDLRPHVDAAVENIKQQASGWAASVGGNIISSVGSLAGFLGNMFLVLVLSFLMLLEGPTWLERFWAVYRNEARREHHKELSRKVYGVVTGYINGQLTVSGIGGLGAGLFVFILSFIFSEISANLAMPTILLTFILTLIPMFGATIAGVLMTILLLLSNVTAGITYAIFFTLYQQVENNFISPTIQAKTVELSALVVLVAVTVGLYLGGLVGGFIAIPVAGTIKVFIEDYLEHRAPLAEEAETPLKKILKKVQPKK